MQLKDWVHVRKSRAD